MAIRLSREASLALIAAATDFEAAVARIKGAARHLGLLPGGDGITIRHEGIDHSFRVRPSGDVDWGRLHAVTLAELPADEALRAPTAEPAAETPKRGPGRPRKVEAKDAPAPAQAVATVTTPPASAAPTVDDLFDAPAPASPPPAATAPAPAPIPKPPEKMTREAFRDLARKAAAALGATGAEQLRALWGGGSLQTVPEDRFAELAPKVEALLAKATAADKAA